jgi:nanoRNase/pAp phosphatase (c-di-AMP/oligoRNAs hydrolase)
MPINALLELSDKKVLVVSHRSADVDALASASIMRLLLMDRNYVEIGIPEHMNKSAKRLAETMEIPYNMQPDFSEFDVLVIVDLGSYGMLGSFAEAVNGFSGPIFLFDHHSASEDVIAKKENSLIVEDAASTTELLWCFIKRNAPKRLDEQIALLTVCGLISDTAHFSFASKDTFRVMAEAMEKTDKTFSEIMELFSVKRELSERIAMLKAAQRTRIFRAGKTIIALSEIGAFESQSASALLHLGADVAFVGTIEDESVRISGRAKFSFVQEYGIDLAKDVFQKLSKFFQGEGGGHVTAAAFTGRASSLEDILKKCLELIVEKMKEKEPALSIKEYEEK